MKLEFLILLPLVFSCLILLTEKFRYTLSILFSLIVFIYNLLLVIFFQNQQEVVFNLLPQYNISFVLSNNLLSLYSCLSASFFTSLVVVYSKNLLFIEKEKIYFFLILLTLSFTNLTLLTKNLILFLISWEILGLLVYTIVRLFTPNDDYKLATKTINILGITDFCLLFGIILLIVTTGKEVIKNFGLKISEYPLIFVLLTIGSLGKIGAVPFHTWIPDVAEKLPSCIIGYLIGALDKIIGIYWLVLITNNIFKLQMSNFLMVLGTLTIIIGVFMALVQHNLKRLLSYHAISQIGYMILGISTGSPLGLAGGVFHMINNTIYKTSLFLSSGIVEQKTGDVELEKQKALAKYLPYTFVSTLIASMSISGIPPFNGFLSKWLIYQSLVENIVKTKSIIVSLCLIGAMFGSALTLASFIKVLYSLFFGKDGNIEKYNLKDDIHFVIPNLILSLLCVLFGVFAFAIPIRYIIKPMLGFNLENILGYWNTTLATLLLIMGLLLGLALYTFTIKIRKVNNYLLGEEEKLKDIKIPSTDFYIPIIRIYPFSIIYTFAEQKLLDFYNWWVALVEGLSYITKVILQLDIFDPYKFGKKIVLKIAERLSNLHTGNLHTYLSWTITGFLIISLIFLFLIK
jgi:formate hydrogenlyase subunit 3/multisubunit Na+/H+ antiporter MnhD subunit